MKIFFLSAVLIISSCFKSFAFKAVDIKNQTTFCDNVTAQDLAKDKQFGELADLYKGLFVELNIRCGLDNIYHEQGEVAIDAEINKLELQYPSGECPIIELKELLRLHSSSVEKMDIFIQNVSQKYEVLRVKYCNFNIADTGFRTLFGEAYNIYCKQNGIAAKFGACEDDLDDCEDDAEDGYYERFLACGGVLATGAAFGPGGAAIGLGGSVWCQWKNWRKYRRNLKSCMRKYNECKHK